MYYISEALSDTQTQYSELEKMVYEVVMVYCKLKHYSAHLVSIPTTFPTREILSNR